MSSRARLAALASVVAVPLVGYPIVVTAGSSPPFPDTAECARAARAGEERELEIVYGRFDSAGQAEELAERARTIGYRDTTAEPDGCGRWKVANGAVDSYSGGADAIEEGRRAGLDGVLEVDPG